MNYFKNKYLIPGESGLSRELSPGTDVIDLNNLVLSLVNTHQWEEKEEQICKKLSAIVDINSRFETFYKPDWKKHPDSVPAGSLLSSLVAFVLYVSFKKLQNSQSPILVLFRRMNAILKALDVAHEPWINENSRLYKDIQADLNQLLGFQAWSSHFSAQDLLNNQYMVLNNKTIPVTVLYSEGPIARAYIETFSLLGLKPEKMIHMVSGIDIATRKKVGRYLPVNLRAIYARVTEESKINYWPRYIERKYAELQTSIFDELTLKFNIPCRSLYKTTKKIHLTDYCDNVETILVNGLSDEILLDRLENIKGTILYTGGGIVPSSLLNIEGNRFIHIHPGYLPDIKGADCTLWSSLLYGRTSASCFYMSDRIDTGDILLRRWMPNLNINIDVNKYNDTTLYRTIYSFIDPWIRAVVLRELLGRFHEIIESAAISQKSDSGQMYHFMHPHIKSAAIHKLLSPE